MPYMSTCMYPARSRGGVPSSVPSPTLRSDTHGHAHPHGVMYDHSTTRPRARRSSTRHGSCITRQWPWSGVVDHTRPVASAITDQGTGARGEPSGSASGLVKSEEWQAVGAWPGHARMSAKAL